MFSLTEPGASPAFTVFTASPQLAAASLSSPSPSALPSWPPCLPFVHSLLLLKTKLQTKAIVRVYCTSFRGNGTLARISEESPKVYSLGRGFQVSHHNSAYLDSCLGLSSPRPGSPIHNLIPENPISITSVSQKSRENILRSHSRTAALGTAKNRSHSLPENQHPPIIIETGNVSPQSCHAHSGAGRERIDQCHFMSKNVQNDPREGANALLA